MKKGSSIEWTEVTWNPTTGCNKVSEGCKNCYAERWAFMQHKRGINQYSEGFKFRLAENRLRDPLSWKHPRVVFVNSMSDLFHEQMPLEYLQAVFEIMNLSPQHTYQILTKRIEAVIELMHHVTWSSNIWLGVSVENNKVKDRIDLLKKTSAYVKFISFEPLLERIHNIDLSGINWVIVGGESGGGARAIEKLWVEDLRDECSTRDIPFFFKQWGSKLFNPDQYDPTIDRTHELHSKGGCLIDGKLFRQVPQHVYGT